MGIIWILARTRRPRSVSSGLSSVTATRLLAQLPTKSSPKSHFGSKIYTKTINYVHSNIHDGRSLSTPTTTSPLPLHAIQSPNPPIHPPLLRSIPPNNRNHIPLSTSGEPVNHSVTFCSLPL